MKIMTLNLNFLGTRHGDWLARRRLICGAIKQHEPDVVALQAVRSEPTTEGGLDQAAQLSRTLGSYRHVLFQAALERQDGAADGSAFLSRSSMLENGHLPLALPTAGEDLNRRIVLHTAIPYKSDVLHLFNGHCSWVEDVARRNLEEALLWMEGFDGEKLFLGDLNTPPESPVLRALSEHGWVDAWQELRPAEQGFTFEAHQPEKRIDYIWVTAGLRSALRRIELVAAAEDVSSSLTPVGEPTGIRLSDHLGLLLELEA